MGKAGILAPEDRVELLGREVIVMSPIGNRHAACVGRLTNGFAQSDTEPSHRGYGFVRRYVAGDVLAPSALLEVKLEVAGIIPARPRA